MGGWVGGWVGDGWVGGRVAGPVEWVGGQRVSRCALSSPRSALHVCFERPQESRHVLHVRPQSSPARSSAASPCVRACRRCKRWRPPACRPCQMQCGWSWRRFSRAAAWRTCRRCRSRSGWVASDHDARLFGEWGQVGWRAGGVAADRCGRTRLNALARCCSVWPGWVLNPGASLLAAVLNPGEQPSEAAAHPNFSISPHSCACSSHCRRSCGAHAWRSWIRWVLLPCCGHRASATQATKACSCCCHTAQNGPPNQWSNSASYV